MRKFGVKWHNTKSKQGASQYPQAPWASRMARK